MPKLFHENIIFEKKQWWRGDMQGHSKTWVLFYFFIWCRLHHCFSRVSLSYILMICHFFLMYISVFKNYILIIFNPMLSLLEFWCLLLWSSFLYNSIFHTYLNKESNLPGIITDCIWLVQGLEFNIDSDLLFT